MAQRLLHAMKQALANAKQMSGDKMEIMKELVELQNYNSLHEAYQRSNDKLFSDILDKHVINNKEILEQTKVILY